MDPYTAYDDKGMSPIDLGVDILAAPFKPSTYMWTYTHMPSLWSGTKGLALPFSKEAASKALGAAGKAFGQGRIFAGLGHTLTLPTALRPFGGTRVLADQIGQNQKLLQFYTEKRLATIGPRIQVRQEKIQKIVTKFKTRLSEMKGTKGVVSMHSKAKASFVRYRALSRRWIPQHQKAIAQLQKKGAQYASKVASLQNKIAIGRLAKFGIQAGKAVAVVGALSFAWDIAKMVGEPIGRAVVSELDTALSTWNERFMPELGGRLEMTYLTQGAATDRQRALNAMSKAQITGRSAFGQEAKYAHQ